MQAYEEILGQGRKCVDDILLEAMEEFQVLWGWWPSYPWKKNLVRLRLLGLFEQTMVQNCLSSVAWKPCGLVAEEWGIDDQHSSNLKVVESANNSFTTLIDNIHAAFVH